MPSCSAPTSGSLQLLAWLMSGYTRPKPWMLSILGTRNFGPVASLSPHSRLRVTRKCSGVQSGPRAQWSFNVAIIPDHTLFTVIIALSSPSPALLSLLLSPSTSLPPPQPPFQSPTTSPFTSGEGEPELLQILPSLHFLQQPQTLSFMSPASPYPDTLEGYRASYYSSVDSPASASGPWQPSPLGHPLPKLCLRLPSGCPGTPGRGSAPTHSSSLPYPSQVFSAKGSGFSSPGPRHATCCSATFRIFSEAFLRAPETPASFPTHSGC